MTQIQQPAAQPLFSTLPLRERLIIGLDVPNIKTAERLVTALGETTEFYKIGYQLVLSGGLDFAKDLIADGKKVFLDMKLLDIDNTIAKAVENAAKLGVSMLTLHAYPKAMRAAAQAAQGSRLCLLGVTVLTSMDTENLAEAGYYQTAEELVLKRARQAKDANMGGIVASAAEARAVRAIIGKDMAVVTPGIRLPDQDKGDQKRVMTPAQAIKAGASHLVVARPVTQANEPKAAAQIILANMKQGLTQKYFIFPAHFS